MKSRQELLEALYKLNEESQISETSQMLDNFIDRKITNEQVEIYLNKSELKNSPEVSLFIENCKDKKFYQNLSKSNSLSDSAVAKALSSYVTHILIQESQSEVMNSRRFFDYFDLTSVLKLIEEYTQSGSIDRNLLQKVLLKLEFSGGDD